MIARLSEPIKNRATRILRLVDIRVSQQMTDVDADVKKVDWAASCRVLQKYDKNQPPEVVPLIDLYVQCPDHPSLGRAFAVGKQKYIVRASFPTIAERSPVVAAMLRDALKDEPIAIGPDVDMDRDEERVAFLDLWLSLMGLKSETNALRFMSANEIVAWWHWIEWFSVSPRVKHWQEASCFVMCHKIRTHGVSDKLDPRLEVMLKRVWNEIMKDVPPFAHVAQAIQDVWRLRHKNEAKEHEQDVRWLHALREGDWKAMRAASFARSKQFVDNVEAKTCQSEWHSTLEPETERWRIAVKWTVMVREVFELTEEEMPLPDDVNAVYRQASLRPEFAIVRNAVLTTFAPPSRYLDSLLNLFPRVETKTIKLISDDRPWGVEASVCDS